MTSSTTIEKEIVQMEFDARKFREGVKQSTDDLSAFKKSFDMKTAVDALSELEKASNLDFSGMAQSLESINNKLSLIGVAAGVMVAKVTDAVLGAARSLVDTVILDPVVTGLEEYETQLNAVQTILANTQKQGTTLKDVNGALDELNTYADLTIYNFTQMTENIGKFTAAGVELDTSVSAIKGIANLAALSGSNSQQAATAMYQLSQAISTGSLKLMDWNSVVNAGMGGQVFQDALKETARAHGVAVDSIIKQEGSFRDSLQKGWISSEILLETLNKLTGDLSDAQLEQMGYTEEQIVEIQKQAQTALDAATKIKTVTQLIDTMKEAMQSGWSLTWRTIFGDFEQAKELWGGVAEILGGLIEAEANYRNHILKVWADIGGRDKLIEGFFNILNAGVNVIMAFKDAVTDVFEPLTTLDLYRATKAFLAFSERLKSGSEGLKNFKSIVRGVASVIDILFKIISAIIKPIFILLKGVQLVDGGLWFLLGRVADAIYLWREWAIETGWFAKLSLKILVILRTLRFQLVRLVKTFLKLDVVQNVINWFKSIEITSKDLANVWKTFKTILTALVAPFYLIATGAKLLVQEILNLKVVQDVANWWNSIDWELTAQWFKDLAANVEETFNEFKNFLTLDAPQWFKDVSASIKEMFDEFKNSDVIQSVLGYLETFDGRRIKQFQKDAAEGFQWMDTAAEFLGPKIEALVGWIKDDLGPAAKELGANILQGIKDAFNYLTEDAENLDYTTLFDIINAGIFGAIALALKKIASGDFISGIIDDSDFGEGLLDMFDRLDSTLGSLQNNIRADTLQKIAISIGVLAGSIWLLTLIDRQKLRDSTAAIAIMVAALFGSAGALGRIDHKSAIQASLAIIGISIALNFLGTALRIISGIDPTEMQNGLLAMGAGLTGLIVAVEKLRTGTGTLKTILVMQGIALALFAIWGVIKLFGNTDQDVLTQGLIGIAGALLIMSGAIAIIQKTSGKDKNSSLKAAVAMLAIAKSMDKLFEAVLKFGLLKEEVLIQGLATIGALLLGMAVFSRGIKTGTILQGAIAMLIMGGALIVVSEAIKILGTLSMYEIFVGLLTIASVLAILTIAANMMKTALPGALAIFVMAAALVVLGGALSIIGSLSMEDILKGLVAVAVFLGIFVIAGYLLAPVVVVLLAFGAALFLIGAGAALFGIGIFLAAAGLAALAGSAIAIGEAIRIVGAALSDTLPELATGFALAVAGFMITLAEKAPEMKEAFKTLLLTFITAITEVIPEIVTAIVTMVGELITALLTAVVDLYDDIVQAGWDLLIEFLSGIADNIEEAVETALSIVENFIQGITDGLPDVIAAAVELYFTFLETIEQEVITAENIQRTIDIGAKIAGNIVDGLVNGLANGVGRIVGKVMDLVNQAKAAFTGGMEEGSPSRFTYRVGVNVVLGFVNSLRDNITQVRDAVTNFTSEAKKQFDPFIQALSQEIDQAVGFNPVISPVLDLDGVTAGAGLIQGAFNRITVPAEFSAIGTPLYRPSSDNENSLRSSSDGVTYIQNNYSPKALDRETIYRQTKTQVARLSMRALES